MTTHISNQASDSPAASTDTNAKETRRQQSPWLAVEVSKLREALAEVAKATKPSSPAIDFGRYVRREVERSPDRVKGMFALARLLKCDPTGQEIESLKRDVADLRNGFLGQTSPPRSARRKTNGRGGPKPAGDGKTKAAGKTNKRATKKQASKLLRQLEKHVLQEVRDELGSPSDPVIRGEMVERVYSKSDAELTAMLHERFDFPLSGRKTLYRTPEYKSWAPHRGRGNSRRLDPESPAVDATAAGGESSASGATRNAGYLAENGLSEYRFGTIRPLDAEGRRKINRDPESRAFALNHPELFGEDAKPCG